LAVQTFTHTPEYALHFGEKKPQTIGAGYGKGRVWMAMKEPTDIIEASNDRVRFNVYKGRDVSEYALHRTHDNKWLLRNVTQTKDTAGVPLSRPPYRSTTPNAVDVTDDSTVMQAKIDGAHNLFKLDGNQPIRVFSHRESERGNGLIEHTHRFIPGLTVRVPAHLGNLVIRGELVASDPHTGQARQAVETGAVLNSNVWKARELQAHSPLRAVIFDVARRDGQDVTGLPYKEKLEILKKVNKALPMLELPPMASTAKEKIELLARIRTGREPLTHEGVVQWPLAGGAPIKAKLLDTHDVYVRDIFTEQGDRGEMAGGFEYSWTPAGKVVGRVGSGFNHEMKRDMHANPEKYIGRVAKVTAQDVYRDAGNPKKPGALRGASFSEWHLDKGLQPFEEKTAGSRLREAVRIVKGTHGTWPAYRLQLGDRTIGTMVLKPNKSITQVQGVKINPEFRGMGLGKKFYGDVMRQQPQGILRSDTQVSSDAQALWDSLIRRYNGKIHPGITRVPEAQQTAWRATQSSRPPRFEISDFDAAQNRPYNFEVQLPQKALLPPKER
jgi:hypothetical protein